MRISNKEKMLLRLKRIAGQWKEEDMPSMIDRDQWTKESLEILITQDGNCDGVRVSSCAFCGIYDKCDTLMDYEDKKKEALVEYVIRYGKDSLVEALI